MAPGLVLEVIYARRMLILCKANAPAPPPLPISITTGAFEVPPRNHFGVTPNGTLNGTPNVMPTVTPTVTPTVAPAVTPPLPPPPSPPPQLPLPPQRYGRSKPHFDGATRAHNNNRQCRCPPSRSASTNFPAIVLSASDMHTLPSPPPPPPSPPLFLPPTSPPPPP